jgi:hypothetical protein
MPFFGNLDGAARCADMQAFSYSIANARFSRSINDDTKKFVSFTPETEKPSTIGKALDCAQGIAALGTIRKGISGTANFVKLENIYTSGAYAKTTEIMGLFDTKLRYKSGSFDEITSITNQFSSPTAALLTKVFYDQTQRASNLSALAESMYQVAK